MLDWIQGIFDAVYIAYLEVVESTVVAAVLLLSLCNSVSPKNPWELVQSGL